MNFNSKDERFMTQALELAGQGTALASPGARVGAVVLDPAGAVAGTGFYTYDGLEHAEVIALRQAGKRARGGTLYVNLEPCSHHGRTPPCADQVVAAGIGRVVAAIADPNPVVAGKGFARLRAAGIEVDAGLCERAARRMNEGFARFILDARPLVTLKSAMTLDAKIASAGHAEEGGSRSSTFITGPESRAHVQELRHEADAIMVGIGTVLADNPLLTDRTGRPRRRPLLRVILDSRLRLPLESRLVQSLAGDLVVFCSRPDTDKKNALVARGIRIERMPLTADGRIDLWSVIERLGELNIANLLLEGGSQVNAAALSAGIVDKVFFYYAPGVYGSSSVPFASGAALDEPVHISNIAMHRFGEDIALEGYVLDPFVSAARGDRRQKVEERL